MNRSLLLIALPALALSACALTLGVRRLSAGARAARVAELPFPQGGEVVLDRAGEIILSLRGAAGARTFAGVEFTLRDGAGTPVPAGVIVARAQRTTLAGEVTLSVRRFVVPAPGRYRLEADNVTQQSSPGTARLILRWAQGVRLAAGIAWVVSAAVFLVASLATSLVLALSA